MEFHGKTEQQTLNDIEKRSDNNIGVTSMLLQRSGFLVRDATPGIMAVESKYWFRQRKSKRTPPLKSSECNAIMSF